MSKVGRCVFAPTELISSDPCNRSPSEEEVTITRMLDKIIRRSDVIDKESLCVQSGQRVQYGHRSFIRFLTRLKSPGLEFTAHGSFPGRLGKYARLCMLSGNCCAEALSTARGGGCG